MRNGFEETVLDMFYDHFKQWFTDLENPKIDITNRESVDQFLKDVLWDKNDTPFLITFWRYMASGYIKENSILYENFIIGDLHQYCTGTIENTDVEAEQIWIVALQNYLDVAFEIVQVQADGSASTLKLPEGVEHDPTKFVSNLLFTPGHYDALYT